MKLELVDAESSWKSDISSGLIALKYRPAIKFPQKNHKNYASVQEMNLDIQSYILNNTFFCLFVSKKQTVMEMPQKE